MARLYTNENFPQPAAEELRRLGHDVLTVQDAGNAGQAVPDIQVLDFAKGKGRAIVTLPSSGGWEGDAIGYAPSCLSTRSKPV